MSLGLKLERAVEALKSGGVIAYPTEAVFGLGCDPMNEAAVAKLIELKGRPAAKGVILIGTSLNQFRSFIRDLTPEQSQRIQLGWPGPVTWVVPANPDTAPWLRGAHDTLAIRVPGHKIARELCAAWGGPIVSTSANPAGQAPARSAAQVSAMFKEGIDFVLDEAVGGAQNASEIRDLIKDRVLRSG